jgi:hypothetical protein
MSNRISDEQKYFNRYIKSVYNGSKTIPDPSKFNISEKFYENLTFSAVNGKPCRKFQRIRGFAKTMNLSVPEWFQKRNMGA